MPNPPRTRPETAIDDRLILADDTPLHRLLAPRIPVEARCRACQRVRPIDLLALARRRGLTLDGLIGQHLRRDGDSY